MDRTEARARILAAFGAGPAETEELLAYDESPFDHARLPRPLALPPPPEAHVATWERYAVEAAQRGVYETLGRHLPRLRFPIKAGISQTESYRAATLRGVSPDGMAEATGLRLDHPERLRLLVHRSLAGPVPVLIAGDRADFVALVRALSMRNEPAPVPASMGACTVKGFNNWDRIREYRRQWEAQDPANRGEAAWAAAFRRLIRRPELYQDRFMILSEGPYSDVPAADLGLADDEWRRLSVAIRLEHECTHYLTLRLFGVTRNNALDELLCDYTGIAAAAGRFRADWLLRFIGLEGFPRYRDGGRLQNYLGQPPLSDGAFTILRALVKAAADNLERFDAERFPVVEPASDRGPALLALSQLTLEELASDRAVELLGRLMKHEDPFAAPAGPELA
jgi:hypothetical protein